MRIGRRALLAVGLISVLFGTGCGQIKAKAAFKDGNKFYKEESYRKAISEYQKALQYEPDMAEAYFYLGSSYQALYRPGKDEQENVQNLHDAVANYKKCLEILKPDSPELVKVRLNALGALTGIYSEDPLRDEKQALDYALELTKDNPNDIKNLYALANLHKKFGRIAEAEEAYKKVAELNPTDPKACGQLASFYNETLWDDKGSVFVEGQSKGARRGLFGNAVATLERCAEINPSDPEGHFKISTFYWDKAYRDPSLSDKQKAEFVEKGLAAVDKAIEIKPDFWQAIIYKGLLYRVKATIDTANRNTWVEKAVDLSRIAGEIRKQIQASEQGVPPEAGAPPEASPQ